MSEDRAGRELIVKMLDVLKRYSDAEHPMTQKEIGERLENVCNGKKPDRKTIKRTLSRLIEMYDEISYKEKKRGEAEPVITDIYYTRQFMDEELYLLINAVMCSPYIKAADARDLVERLSGLSSIYFKDKAASIPPVDDAADTNPEYFLNLDKLRDAIQEERQVTFNYCSYAEDMKLHPRTRSDGTIRRYRVSPYRVVEVKGRTYLICNTDGKEGVSNYRVDKMKDTKVAPEPARPAREMKDLVAGLLDLPKYLAEHMNMSFAETVNCTFSFNNSILNMVVDTFGTRLEILKHGESATVARVSIDKDAMCVWALQYPDCVRVLEPESLVQAIRDKFSVGAAAYQE